MKSIIENLHRFIYLNDAQKNSLEQKAQAHLRYSNIVFNVMKVDDKEVIIQTAQLKHLSENYANADHLVKVTESVFAPMLYGRKLKVGAKPYVPAPADIVTPQWIRDLMAKQKLKATDLELLLGIDKSTLSLYISGKRELSRGVKSMFFYFFAFNELVKSKGPNDDVNKELAMWAGASFEDKENAPFRRYSDGSTGAIRYYHPSVGYGDFVKEYNGRHGKGIIIRLDNGKEWFAPINEFTAVEK